MTSNTTLVRRRKGRRYFWLGALVMFVYFALVVALYVFQPFESATNDFLSNLVTVISSLASAVIATMIWMQYDKLDAPRRIWGQFAFATWLWLIAEIIWSTLATVYGEVADVTIADFFWVSAYGFFAAALYWQYVIMFESGNQRAVFWTVIWLSCVVVFTVITAWLLNRNTGQPWGWALWIASFYPAADLVIGIGALRLVQHFRRGALGYPWLGLLAFAFADVLYAVVDMSGAYRVSLDQGNYLATIADLSYIAAYLLVTLGCYMQLLLLKHGPIFSASRK